jgi:CheY-like chemotaxis protein
MPCIPLSVLILDDDLDVARAIAQDLQKAVRIDVEFNADAALARLQNGNGSGLRYDLIVCDLTMRQTTGVELFDRVVDGCPGARERFVFVFADDADPVVLERARASGRPCLAKPVGGDEVVWLAGK